VQIQHIQHWYPRVDTTLVSQCRYSRYNSDIQSRYSTSIPVQIQQIIALVSQSRYIRYNSGIPEQMQQIQYWYPRADTVLVFQWLLWGSAVPHLCNLNCRISDFFPYFFAFVDSHWVVSAESLTEGGGYRVSASLGSLLTASGTSSLNAQSTVILCNKFNTPYHHLFS
jgi:hypothetical protein